MDLTPVVSADLPEDAIRRGSIEGQYDGVVRRLDMSDLAMLAPARLGVIRTSPSYKDKPNYAGYYWAATTGRHHWFESLYEKLALTVLDRDPAVTGIATQPFKILWTSPKKEHFPDILVERGDRSLTLVDVRPREEIRVRDAETLVKPQCVV